MGSAIKGVHASMNGGVSSSQVTTSTTGSSDN